MISVNNVTFRFGSRALYEDVSLHIKPKDRIGLIGANGTGKSTLLRLITGEYNPDEGNISRSNDCTIGFLNQDLLSYQSEDSILHVVMQAFERALIVEKELEEVISKMETEYSDELLDQMTSLQEEYERMDGYTLQSRAEEILEGLGFTTDQLKRPLSTFSGGWRMRVMLAKLLLQNPSLLMLDEPTNHLDMPSIKWIENYLQDYEGAIIVVSHDREFVNNTVTSIVEVSQQKMQYYAGDYEFYLEEKQLRREIQKNSFENQQSQIRQTERFIERFKAKASKSRQVQSRVKALAKLDVIEDVVDATARVNFKFKFNTQSGRNVVELDNVSKSYGPLNILNKSKAMIERGDKIALIGANGRGKSTLLRIISGMEPVEGEVKVGYNVLPSFFAQHQLESLNIENTLLEELKQTGTTKTEMELRSVLGCFLFSGDDVFKKIKVLSGGEKSRVALAKTLISEANFLLLDEPTNHLDIVSVNILIQALQQYEGSFVVVSHDRFFVSQIANKIWFIEDQIIKEYPGTYEEYDEWQMKREREMMKDANSSNSKTLKQSQSSDSVKDEAKKALNQARKQLEHIEQAVTEIEQRKNTLEIKISEAGSNPHQIAELGKELKNIEAEYKQLMNDWEQASAHLDKLEKTSA